MIDVEHDREEPAFAPGRRASGCSGHAVEVAREVGIPAVLVPPNPSTFFGVWSVDSLPEADSAPEAHRRQDRPDADRQDGH
jgi:hypothetical protein